MLPGLLVRIYHNQAGRTDLVFDEKFGLENDFFKILPFDAHGRHLTWPRWKFYKCAANAVIEANKGIVSFDNKISSIQYLKSEKDFLVQAADLLSNLTLNALRLKKGITSGNTKLKSDLINASIKEDFIPDALAKDFDVVDNELVCNNPKHRSSIELSP